MASCDGGTWVGSAVSLHRRAPASACPPRPPLQETRGETVSPQPHGQPLGPPRHGAAPASLSPHLAGGAPGRLC